MVYLSLFFILIEIISSESSKKRKMSCARHRKAQFVQLCISDPAIEDIVILYGMPGRMPA